MNKTWRDLAVFKGTKDGFLVVLDDESEFEAVLQHLRRKVERAEGFFRGAGAVVDAGRRSLSDGEFAQLIHLLREEHGMDQMRTNLVEVLSQYMDVDERNSGITFNPLDRSVSLVANIAVRRIKRNPK